MKFFINFAFVYFRLRNHAFRSRFKDKLQKTGVMRVKNLNKPVASEDGIPVLKHNVAYGRFSRADIAGNRRYLSFSHCFRGPDAAFSV